MYFTDSGRRQGTRWGGAGRCSTRLQSQCNAELGPAPASDPPAPSDGRDWHCQRGRRSGTPGPSPGAASSLWPALQREEAARPVPAGGGGVRRGEDAVQVVLQQLLVHDAWAAARREATVSALSSAATGSGGCTAPWQLVEELADGEGVKGRGKGGGGRGAQAAPPGGHGTWDLAACASSFSLPQLKAPAPALTCDPGLLSVRGQPIALAGERHVSPLGCHPSCLVGGQCPRG